MRPVVHLLDKVYQKGVKLTKEAMNVYEGGDQKVRKFAVVGCYNCAHFGVNYLVGVA